MKQKRIKKLTLDIDKENLSENVKAVILEQVKIIEHLQQEICILREENEELKKNFI